MLGDAVFRDLMGQYDVFLKARADVVAQVNGVPAIAPEPPPVAANKAVIK